MTTMRRMGFPSVWQVTAYGAILADSGREPKASSGVRSLIFGEPSGRGAIPFLPFREGDWMKQVLSAVFAALFALTSVSALACSGDKAKDEKQMSTPSKPKI
jgi:hypothetical protein